MKCERSGLFLVLSLIGVLPGCNRPATTPSGSTSQTSPDVVIFLIDTLRADRLHCYGYEKLTSPKIDELAAEGVVFEWASSPAPWTLPSTVSLMLSTYLAEHRVIVDRDMIDPRSSPLAERLKRVGYATASFWANPYAGPFSGLQRGFDHWRLQEVTDGQVMSDWLKLAAKETPSKPLFTYIHNTEPHDPFVVADRFVKPFGFVAPDARAVIHRNVDAYRKLGRLDFEVGRAPGTYDNSAEQKTAMGELRESRYDYDALYDASVLAADENVGSVMDALRQAGRWENTLFILVADHGEEIDDHGGWQHDQSLYEELVHVPLIVRFPKKQHAGLRISTPVSLIDVAPTILGFVQHGELVDGMRGQSLLACLTRPAEPEKPRVVSMRQNKKKYYKPYKEKRGDLNVAIRNGHWKGIWNIEPDTFELYDLAADPHEKNDLSTVKPEIAGPLLKAAREQFAGFSAAPMKPGLATRDSIDADSRRALGAMGYVSRDDPEATTQPANTQPAAKP